MKLLNKISQILDRQQKRRIVMLFFVIFIGGILELVGVSLILPVINVIMNENILLEGKWATAIQNFFHIQDGNEFLIILLGTLVFIYVLKNLYLIGMYKLTYQFTYYYKKKLAMRLLECYMFQTYTFHLSKNVADLQRNIITDIGNFYDLITNCLNLLNELTVCMLLGIYLLGIDWKTALSVFFLLGGALAVFYSTQKRVQTQRGIENRNSMAALNKWIIQSFNGIKEIQVLGREDYFLDKCEKAYEWQKEANKKNNLAALIPKPIMEMVCVCTLLAVMMVRIASGVELQSFFSVLAVFAVAAFRMLPSFNRMSAYLAAILFQKDSVNSVYEDIKEMERLDQNFGVCENKATLVFDKEIKLQDITFKYPGTEKLILDHVNLIIHKNQSIGFTGTSGAGKSTLIDIILGVLPLEKGKILVDGYDIYKNMKGWHNILGYIPQSIYLMDDNIRNNVAFGIPDEQVSDEKIWKALEKAQIADFVHSLAEGLDTEIGDRGVRISGGQRQRLGIARALYNDPQILVFDEATSALDNETEAALMEAINGLRGSKTMIIIAHRLHTIENCDVIYEVGSGNIRETMI